MDNTNNYFKANISNMVQDAISSDKPVKFSSFLTIQEQDEAVKILNHYKFNNYLFFGGNEECERVILGVFVDYIQPNFNEFPISCIKIVPTSKNCNLSHRDYLGSIMGLQLKREVIGDIFCFDDYGVVFVNNGIKDYVLSNLEKIGKTKVNLSIVNALNLKNNKKFIEIKGTISSLRLDCIVAFLIAKSRTNASSIIVSGVVSINSSVATNVSKVLKAGDIIVIKGKGKFILCDNIKQTKKDRLFIVVNKLL